jgi:hypothetical protein
MLHLDIEAVKPKVAPSGSGGGGLLNQRQQTARELQRALQHRVAHHFTPADQQMLDRFQLRFEIVQVLPSRERK